MKEIFTVITPCVNPVARNCPPAAVERFREDLKQYEKDHKMELPKDENGEYQILSQSLRELDWFLYVSNTYSRTILYPIVRPEIMKHPAKEHPAKELYLKYAGKLAALKSNGGEKNPAEDLLTEICSDLTKLL